MGEVDQDIMDTFGDHWDNVTVCWPDPKGEPSPTLVSYSYDENNGGCSHGMQHCFRVSWSPDHDNWYSDKDGTDYRCGCNKVFPVDGPDCRTRLEPYCTVAIVVYSIQAIIAFAQLCRALWTLRNLIKLSLLQQKKKIFDAVTVTALFLSLGLGFNTIMTLSFVLRTMTIIDDPAFNVWIISVPFCVMFIAQSLNSLAVAWLDVGINSSKVGGASVSHLRRVRVMLKGLGFTVFVLSICLFVTGNVVPIGIVCNIASLLLSIAFRVGGSRLASMLTNGKSDDKGTKTAKAIKSYYTVLEFSQPGTFMAVGTYTWAHMHVIELGQRHPYTISVSMCIMLLAIQITASAGLNFIYKVRLTKVGGKIQALTSSRRSSRMESETVPS